MRSRKVKLVRQLRSICASWLSDKRSSLRLERLTRLMVVSLFLFKLILIRQCSMLRSIYLKLLSLSIRNLRLKGIFYTIWLFISWKLLKQICWSLLLAILSSLREDRRLISIEDNWFLLRLMKLMFCRLERFA